MRILLTNDDGILAPGLLHLWKIAKQFGEVTVVAPLINQSGVSLGNTVHEPITLQQVAWQEGCSAWAVSGTPSDCVKMAISVVLQDKPDLVISGINAGSNAGRTALYSGTVAGAIEACIKGIPSLALSCAEFLSPRYERTDAAIKTIIEHILDQPMEKGSFLNVNFPETEQILGLRLARQGKGLWGEEPDKRDHPAGHHYYWLGCKYRNFEEAEDSDVRLLQQGYITAVPLYIEELTHFRELENRKAIFDSLYKHADN